MTNMVVLVKMAILMIFVNLSSVNSGEYGDSVKSVNFGEFIDFVNLVIHVNIEIQFNSGFC